MHSDVKRLLSKVLILACFFGSPPTFASYTTSLEGLAHSPSHIIQDDIYAEVDDDEDPFEGFNRFMFAFNELLDGILLKPLALTYDFIFPAPIKESLSAFLDNLSEPVTFINDVLQLKPERAGQTLARFAMNTTLGMGGLFDVAGEWANLERHKEDFGQTLAHAGLEGGPYLVLPFLGPSNPRDMLGKAVDLLLDPVDYGLRRAHHRELTYVRKGVDTVRKRAEALPLTDSIDKTAIDKYIKIRTLYIQNRRFKLEDGSVSFSEVDSVEMVE